MYFPLWPVYLIDIGGSAVIILFSLMSFSLASKLRRKERENPFWVYLLWFSFSMVVFSLSRGIGHILQYLFVFTGHARIWQLLNPISGSLNTISFVFTGSVSLFFLALQGIYQQILSDKDRMAGLNRELSSINNELDSIISERALNLMALAVADKLRNPATVIGSVAKKLAKDPGTAEDVRQKLTPIIESAERLEGIVEEFDKILKSKETFFSFEDLNDIVRETVSLNEGEVLRKEISIRLNLSPMPVKFYAIRHLVRLAISHILKNAIEASPEGAVVTVNTGRTERRIFLSVKDEGPAVSEKDLPMLFELFYSTKGRLGTGLSIAKQIIEEHGGDITVESAPGKGTIFTVSFPSGWLEFDREAGEDRETPHHFKSADAQVSPPPNASRRT